MQAILSNNTRKLIRFKSTKMLIAVLKIIFCVIYNHFRHIFVPYAEKHLCNSRASLCLSVRLSVRLSHTLRPPQLQVCC